MPISLKPLKEQVMVITGASSGIGLATAKSAAKQGAKLVLASRNEEALRDIVSEITGQGGEAIYVVADVSNREDLERVAAEAIRRFGGFNTWVNDAGLSIFGKLEDIAEEDHRRMFDINFWGLVNGSLIAVKHLKQHGGALINLGSVASDQTFPRQSMYCATKHAIKSFTDGLRMELMEDGWPVSITLIKPAAIDTPFPQHARNYMDKEPKLPDPVYPPEEVANAILHAAVKPIRDVYIGGGGKLMSAIGKHAPNLMDRLGSGIMGKQQERPNEAPRDPDGALYHPGKDGRVRGDHPGYVTKTSAYTRATLHPVVTGAVVAAVGLGVAALLTSGDRKR